MRVALCRWNGADYSAVVQGERLALMPLGQGGVLELLGAESRSPLETVSFDDVTFLPPVAASKIIAVGLNYADHAAEAAAEAPPHPSLFPRFADSLVGHGEPLLAPSVSEQFDYEGELAVIIGSPAWRVDREAAMSHVAGYACFAENSVRDFQLHARQVTAGKNFYRSGAFGPWLTTVDEVPDVANLELVTRLNGHVMQKASVGDLIYDIPTLISYISQFTPLRPGDVIATGTPSGVGAVRKPPVWMKPGDTLEIEISGVGLLANPVASDASFTPFQD